MGRTKEWGYPLGSTESAVVQFLTPARPHAIIVANNDFSGDNYVFVHELFFEDAAYSDMAVNNDWVIYCADQTAVDNLNDILHEMDINFYNFIPQKGLFP